MQPHLFDEVALVLLLLVKEPGFLPAVSDKGLKKDDGQNTKIHEERRGRMESKIKGIPGQWE